MATKKKPATKKEPVQLRKPQVRILSALAKAKGALSRKEISERANVDLAWIGTYAGSGDAKIRAKGDKKFKSLVTLGLAKVDDDGLYSITAAGRKAAPQKPICVISLGR